MKADGMSIMEFRMKQVENKNIRAQLRLAKEERKKIRETAIGNDTDCVGINLVARWICIGLFIIIGTLAVTLSIKGEIETHYNDQLYSKCMSEAIQAKVLADCSNLNVLKK